MNYLITVMLAVSLLACSSGSPKRYARHDAYVAPMKGKSADQLIQAWGAPEETVTQPNGNQVMVYIEQQEVKVKEYSIITGRKEKVPKEYTCKTSFEIGPDNQVLGYTFEGNGCGSTKLRPKEE